MLLMTSALALLLAAAPDPNGVEAALGRPLSPGAVALLLQHAADPRAGARLVEALSHERADVRAAAARVVGSVGLRPGLPALAQAVAREDDAVAGIEEVRALALLADSTDADLLRAVAGVGPAAVDTWASTRALAHPDRLLDELPALREAGLGEEQLVEGLARAADREPGITARVREKALGAGDARLWRTADRVAGLGAGPETCELLARALAQPALREAAAWSLAALPEPPPAGSPCVAAVEALLPAEGSRPLPLELAARRLGRAPVDRSAEVGSLDGPALVLLFDFVSRGGGPRVTAEERRALEARPGAPSLDSLPTLAARPREGQAPVGGLRLAAPLPPGYAADTLAVAGCKLDGKMTGGWVSYREDGRAKDVRLFRDLGLSPGCLTATAALLASLHEGARWVAREGEIVLLPLEADVVACGQREPPQPRGSAQSPRTVGLELEEPRKVHHVNPAYPRAAANAGVGGVVVLKAVITTAGCVGSLELVQGAQRLLDVEALRAVSQWRYTPTRVNGQPVPVAMMVTVSFKVTAPPRLVIRR